MCESYVFNIRNVKLHLSQLNYFCFMQLASSKQLAKDSNSVSTQGKEMLSLHVCTNCIYFYKYGIAFVAINCLCFMLVAPSIQLPDEMMLCRPRVW